MTKGQLIKIIRDLHDDTPVYLLQQKIGEEYVPTELIIKESFYVNTDRKLIRIVIK